MDSEIPDQSADSVSTSDEFEVVSPGQNNNPSPGLYIADNGNIEELTEKLGELLAEESSDKNPSTSPNLPDQDTGQAEERVHTPVVVIAEPSTDTTPNEPDGDNKAADDYALFDRVAYLGAANINAPRSEIEIQRNMSILNSQSTGQAVQGSMTIPSHSEGAVILYDAQTQQEMARYFVHRILFFARGAANSPEASCFAFTCARGDSQESAIFQCHVFRCDIPEAVNKVNASFAQAFRRPSKAAEAKMNKPKLENPQTIVFEVLLEIREEDNKGNFAAVPKDKQFFKLRAGLEKKVVLTVSQINDDGLELPIERSFGLLISPGRNVKHSDMHLLEMVSMGTNNHEKGSSYVITGHWDPNDPAFDLLNRETSKELAWIYMTLAVDLVIHGIREPVRFFMETKARVFPQQERFWYFSRKQRVEQFTLNLKEVESEIDRQFEVLEIVPSGELDKPHRPVNSGMSMSMASMSLSLHLGSLSLTSSTFGSLYSPTPHVVTSPKDEELSDNDEPLLSGSGEVSKECSEGELASWAEVLSAWGQNPDSLDRPRQLSTLVKQGVPEALRGEVWLRLANCAGDSDMMDTYRILITKECSCEAVILRDIHRTFPAHAFFKESGGLGQESLAKISKAYAVYDEEIGYCQGISFVAATLLLHMPEEQAFCVLVQIMFSYGLRDLFKDGFEALHLKFYQLDRLMEEHLPDLWLHFATCGVESHMFASQWFLTLFTAKFPLFLVFHVLDVFLYQGVDTIFQVALALLSASKKDLLAADFEGILKYFRVQLPKRYRNEEAARQLMRNACNTKIRKLKKYEKDWYAIKEHERVQEDPVQRLEREKKRLLEDNMRLERENDSLAHELINSKIGLRAELDAAEDRAETSCKEVASLRRLINEADEDRKRLQNETLQVKEMLKREVQQAELESKRQLAIIAEYKQICSQLSQRLEKEKEKSKEWAEKWKSVVLGCDRCGSRVPELTPPSPVHGSGEEDSIVNKKNPADPAEAERQIKELELELAQTKLALVEAECRNQDLHHHVTALTGEIQATKNTWLQKTLTSIKEVTRKDILNHHSHPSTHRRDSTTN